MATATTSTSVPVVIGGPESDAFWTQLVQLVAARDGQVATTAAKAAITAMTAQLDANYVAKFSAWAQQWAEQFVAQRDQLTAKATMAAVTEYVAREGACVCSCSTCRGRHGRQLDVRVVSMPDRLVTSRQRVERNGKGQITTIEETSVEETA